MKRNAILDLLLFGILFLIFFQLLSDFIESIYAFGLLGTSIPAEIAAVLLFLTPFLLLLLRRGIPGRLLGMTAELALVCRAVAPLLDTRLRMLVSGLGVGLLLVFLPGLLWVYGRRGETARAAALGGGLALGLSLSILLRTLGSGLDLSTLRGSAWIGWITVLPAVALLPGGMRAWASGETLKAGSTRKREGNRGMPLSTTVGDRGTSDKRLIGATGEAGNPLLMALGLFSVLILIYFAFSAPAVLARWTEGNYLILLFLLVLALVVFAATPGPLANLNPTAMAGVNLVFVFSMVGTIFTNAVVFPAEPGRYPLAQATAPSFAGVLLSVALVTAPILIIDFTRLSRAIIAARPSLPALGAVFGLSALYLLVMIFAQVFTTVYDYIPVIGPFFRDRFWLVYFLPGLVLVLALLKTPPGGLLPGAGAGRLYPAALTLLGAAVVTAAWVTASRPAQAVEKEPLRVLTYNIQQGYRADGQRGAVDQLELLRQVDADLIGLQESDTARISGGNADLVRFFADRLDLYSYYGPRTVTGTFGIALLSRYPIENPRTFYMYSAGEQTAAIAAEVTAGGQTYNVFVTHLGNGGPLVQQEQVLAEIDGLPNVIAMGDFNFEPTTEQYRLTTALLADAWLSKWPSGTNEDGNNPDDRIDHIFLSPGMTVSEAQHINSPASDHPAVWIEIMP